MFGMTIIVMKNKKPKKKPESFISGAPHIPPAMPEACEHNSCQRDSDRPGTKTVEFSLKRCFRA